jgi:hypothetical protein
MQGDSMSSKRSFFLVLVSAVTVAGATACNSGLTEPSQLQIEEDLPVRDTSGFVPPPMGS